MKCALLDDYQGIALHMANWGRLEGRLEVVAFRERFDTPQALTAALEGFEVVVAMRERTPFSAQVLAALPALKLLVTTGMRNAAIDLEAARARGVLVCGTASLTPPTAELTWALILGLCRHLALENANLRGGGPWQSTLGLDLHGRTLGLLGLGKIGARVARVGLAFGMRVQAWSQNLTLERAKAEGVTLAPSKVALLETSDVVSLHLVLSGRTRGILGAADFDRIKPGALLVNTARAGLVDTPALIAALERGHLGGAGLDVFDVEPLPTDHPFRTLPNVLATPHLGYVTQDNYRTYYGQVLEDIEAWLEGNPIRVL